MQSHCHKNPVEGRLQDRPRFFLFLCMHVFTLQKIDCVQLYARTKFYTTWFCFTSIRVHGTVDCRGPQDKLIHPFFLLEGIITAILTCILFSLSVFFTGNEWART